MPQPVRKTADLRIGRASCAGTRYFLTICTRKRMPVLTQPTEAQRIIFAFNTLHNEGTFELHGATIMPDHLHLLFTLGTRLTLGQTMAKLKSLARDLGRAPWHWLEDGFEHRLRAEELSEDYGRYIFMNPYRAKLITTDQAWPWWICRSPKLFRFVEQLSAAGTPPAVWLDSPGESEHSIVTGE